MALPLSRSNPPPSRSPRSRPSRPLAVLVWPLALLIALFSGGQSAAAQESGRQLSGTEGRDNRLTTEPELPSLRWVDCGDGFQCTTARVPLTYADPDGEKIELALIKRPAGDPARKVGSLFSNPGGPGVSGVAFVRSSSARFDAHVQERFDIVGMDPRGVAGSTPLRCFDDSAEQAAFYAKFSLVPVTAEEHEAAAGGARELGVRCTERNPRLLPHVSTANVARDLHLLMRAVGDEKLTFYGASYGTYVGQTFATLFPDDVRALVLDGVLVASDYVGGEAAGRLVPTWVRSGSNVATSETLDEFFERCAEVGEVGCVFAAGDPRAKFADILEGLRVAPITVPNPEDPAAPIVLTYGRFISNVVLSLYEDATWPFLGRYLQEAYQLGDPGEPAAAAAAVTVDAADALPAYSNQPESLSALVCTDTNNPIQLSAWPALAAAAEATTPYFGSYWANLTQPCAAWPVTDQDRYTGPWDTEPINPPLVIGTRFDPATRYQNSVSLAADLPGARLLTLDGYGHTAFGRSACVGAAVGEYLVTGELPAADISCAPDRKPFDPLPETPTPTSTTSPGSTTPDITSTVGPMTESATLATGTSTVVAPVGSTTSTSGPAATTASARPTTSAPTTSAPTALVTTSSARVAGLLAFSGAGAIGTVTVLGVALIVGGIIACVAIARTRRTGGGLRR